jgi:hypothetical protein
MGSIISLIRNDMKSEQYILKCSKCGAFVSMSYARALISLDSSFEHFYCPCGKFNLMEQVTLQSFNSSFWNRLKFALSRNGGK